MTRSIFLFVLFFSLSLFANQPYSAGDLVQGQQYMSDFRFYEQALNDKVENTEEFVSIKNQLKLAPQYRPENQMAFDLHSYLIPKDLVAVLSNGKTPIGIVTTGVPEGYVRFFVHPESLEKFEPFLKDAIREKNWQATPTSSYRSLIAWMPEPQGRKLTLHGIKVSLDTVIGGSLRMLWRDQIERATVNSIAFAQVPKEKLARLGIVIIDEPASVYLKGLEAGFSLREVPRLAAGESLVPLFSLYSSNKGESMLSKLVRESGMTQKDFLQQRLMKPLIEHAFYMGMEMGLVGEPHEQNVLVEMKDGKLTGRFFYRDLAGFHIDPKLRAAAGFNMDFVPKDFKQSSLRTDRADLIENVKNYLMHSNFYAMAASVGRSKKGPSPAMVDWVQQETMKLVAEEIRKYTGHQVSQWSSAKAAVTTRAKVPRCSAVL